jgi:hypothetical protein
MDKCLRCNSSFICKSTDISNCNCSKVTISKETKEHLKKTNYDCLCNMCLQKIDKLVYLSNTIPTTATEGLHYIMENGLLVFTELNHIQRGYCCGSDCRNCAYGFKLASNK